MIGAVAIATVALVYPNWRATYEDMKGSEILNFPTVDISPQNILPSDNKIEATVGIYSNSPEGEGDQIEKIWIDIVNTEEGETYVHGHLNFSDARDIINLIKLEYYNETHYRVIIWGHGTEYVKIGDSIGKTVSLSGYYWGYAGSVVNISGFVHIVINSPQEVVIDIDIASNVSFKEFSDSIGVYVLDSSDCEVLVRKYYDPPQTAETSICGLPPLTNRTNYPWDVPMKWSLYAKMVRVRNDYYVAGERVGVLIILGGRNITLTSNSHRIFLFIGGPANICIASPWRGFRSLGRIDVWVDGEYWGDLEFFEFWFFQDPKIIALLIIVFSILLAMWRRRRVHGIEKQ